MGTAVGTTPAGAYVGVYWQDGLSHPIAAQHLACTSVDEVSGTAEGHGFDDVGTFSLRGEFMHTALKLTKRYVLGTGNPYENKGHAVELRLRYCELGAVLPERAVDLQRWGAPAGGGCGFYGTWHIRTAGYSGDAEMVLWLPQEPVVVGFVVQAVPVTETAPLETPVAQAVPVAVPAEEGVPEGKALLG